MELFKLIGTIAVNNQEANKEIDQTTDKAKGAGGKLGTVFSKVGKGAVAFGKTIATGIAAGSAAIGALSVAAIKEYASYEQLVGGVDTLFKKSSKQVQKYAADAYKTAGLSANAYMETVTSFSASLLQGLEGDTKKAAEKANVAITDMSDNANKMGTSMDMIQNAYQGFAKQNYTMLDNLKLGYGGTASEMARLVKDSGILGKEGEKLTAKNLNQKVSFDQIVDAVHKVQSKMGITGTTAKEASTTIEGSVNSMKASWNNLLVGIADGNQDFGKLLDNFVKSVSTVGKNLMPRIKQTIVCIGKLINQLLPVIVKEIPSIINGLLPQLLSAAINLVNSIGSQLPKIIQTLITAIQAQLPAIVKAAMTIFQSIITTVLQSLPQLIQLCVQMLTELMDGITQAAPVLIPQVINGILDAIITLLTNIDKIIDGAIKMVTEIADALVNAIPILIDRLPEIIDKVAGALITNMPKLIKCGVMIPWQLAIGLVKAIPALISKVPEIFSRLKERIMTLGSDVKNWFKEIFTKAVAKIGEAFAHIGGFFSDVWNKIKKPFVHAANWFKGIFQGVVDTISGIFKGIVAVVKAPINFLIGGLNSFIGAMNKIKIPDWVPVVGGKGINIPKIPKLEKGGVLEKGQVGLLEGNGAEAVVPLEKNTGWLDQISARLNGSGNNDELIKRVDNMSTILEKVLNTLVGMDATQTDKIKDALSGTGIEWSDRELGRMVKKFA